MSLAAASVPLLDKEAAENGDDDVQLTRRVSATAVLFELRCVHPFLHAGAGLLACAATVTCFALGALSGTSLRAHEAGGSAADVWAAAKLRIASLLVNSLTAGLVLLLLRSHLASCVVKPQLGGSAAVSVAATVAALGYIAVFVSRAVGSSDQADVADITATIGMAAYTLMMLVWHLSCVAVCNSADAMDENDGAEDAEAKGGSTTIQLTSANDDAALSAAQAEAADFLVSCMPQSPAAPTTSATLPDGETCLVELSRRWPLLLLGAGLLSFAGIVTLWSLARAAPAMIASACAHASDGACARVFGSMGGSDLAEGLTALALNVATLALGSLVLKSEIQACIVQPPPGIGVACLVGAAAAAASLAYAASMRMTACFVLEPGAGELAETAGTVAYAMLLSVWNGVRYFALPPPPHDMNEDEDDDDEDDEGADAEQCAQAERGGGDK